MPGKLPRHETEAGDARPGSERLTPAEGQGGWPATDRPGGPRSGILSCFPSCLFPSSHPHHPPQPRTPCWPAPAPRQNAGMNAANMRPYLARPDGPDDPCPDAGGHAGLWLWRSSPEAPSCTPVAAAAAAATGAAAAAFPGHQGGATRTRATQPWLSLLALSCVLLLEIGINLNSIGRLPGQPWVIPGLLLPVASSVIWLGAGTSSSRWRYAGWDRCRCCCWGRPTA